MRFIALDQADFLFSQAFQSLAGGSSAWRLRLCRGLGDDDRICACGAHMTARPLLPRARQTLPPLFARLGPDGRAPPCLASQAKRLPTAQVDSDSGLPQARGMLIKALSKAERRLAGFKPLPAAQYDSGMSLSRCGKHMKADMSASEARGCAAPVGMCAEGWHARAAKRLLRNHISSPPAAADGCRRSACSTTT